MTGLVAGGNGLRQLFGRLLRWRVRRGWYAIALLTAPVLIATMLMGLSLMAVVYLPAIITAEIC